MDEQIKIKELADTLFSKGLAASMWDAMNKAKDILGISDAKLRQTEAAKENIVENPVDDIMESAGVDIGAVNEEETEKIKKIGEDFKQSHKIDISVKDTPGQEPEPEILDNEPVDKPGQYINSQEKQADEENQNNQEPKKVMEYYEPTENTLPNQEIDQDEIIHEGDSSETADKFQDIKEHNMDDDSEDNDASQDFEIHDNQETTADIYINTDQENDGDDHSGYHEKEAGLDQDIKGDDTQFPQQYAKYHGDVSSLDNPDETEHTSDEQDIYPEKEETSLDSSGEDDSQVYIEDEQDTSEEEPSFETPLDTGQFIPEEEHPIKQPLEQDTSEEESPFEKTNPEQHASEQDTHPEQPIEIEKDTSEEESSFEKTNPEQDTSEEEQSSDDEEYIYFGQPKDGEVDEEMHKENVFSDVDNDKIDQGEKYI